MIKFYAKGDQLVRVPGAQARPGQPDMYVGRNFDPSLRGYPATKDGYEVDENSTSGKRLMRLVRLDDSLYPANESTAALCGVKYIPVEFDSGTFVIKSKQSKQSSSIEG